MKIYKICFIPDGDHLGDAETFDTTWYATEYELRAHWVDQAKEWEEEENEQWEDYGVSSEHPEKFYEIPLVDLKEMTELDGYMFEEYNLPEYEPVFRNGEFHVEKLERNEVCDKSGNPYKFKTAKEAEQFIENLKNLYNQN